MSATVCPLCGMPPDAEPLAALREERDEWKAKAEAYHDSKDGYRERMLAHGREIEALTSTAAALRERAEAAEAVIEHMAGVAYMRRKSPKEVEAHIRGIVDDYLARAEAAEKERDEAREALREWVKARRSLREWMNDKSTPPDDGETDRRYARVEAAENVARVLSGVGDEGGGTRHG
jgi:chromosome segregation ATPase